MAVRKTLNISRWAIRHPILTIGFWIAVVVAGLLAFGSLKYALFPDITFPVIIINGQNQALITSTDTESEITTPIEKSLRGLGGLDDIISTTSIGNTTIRVSFEVGKSIKSAEKEVRDAVDVAKTKKGTNIAIIPINLNESTAATYVVQSEKLTLEQLTLLTKQKLLPSIKSINGVLDVRVLGGPVTMPMGEDYGGVQQFPTTLAKLNGEEVIALEVIKDAEANTLEIVQEADKLIKKLNKTNENIEIIKASTQANYIKEASLATIESIGIAVALSAIVIYPFLWDWKATIISGLAIPTSLCGTFIVMAIFGLKLETITMLAIALVVGIIVDDAIVDVENISRHLELGESPRTATIAATDEVGLTLTAATLTIAAVFIPVASMGGVVGQFFRPFGITASAAVIISLLVSRTLSPLLSMLWLREKKDKKGEESWKGLLSWYEIQLSKALSHRKLVIYATITTLVIGIGLIFVVDKGFIPKLDRGEMIIQFTSEIKSDQKTNQKSTTTQLYDLKQASKILNKTSENAIKIESIVRQVPEVVDIYTTIGDQWGQSNQGKLIVKLSKNRTQKTSAIQEEIRGKLSKLSGITYSVEDIPFVDTGKASPIQIKLEGNSLSELDKTAENVQKLISSIPGIVDVSTASNNVQIDHMVIEHIDGNRVRIVQANLASNLTSEEAINLIKVKTNQNIPKGINLDFGGDSTRIKEIMSSFAFTMLLGIVSIVLVLLLLFKNVTDPLIIIISLPLSLVGAMLAILFTTQEFGVISVIGILFLMGLTNKNAIIMVDYINQLRISGLATRQAILQGATVRLRPILMTTGATILGMLPVAIGVGAGSELRAPMAIAIMGGLLTSSILSLFVIPVAYSIINGLKTKPTSI
jgi:multidrug efflux pump subunit AcrB